MGLREDIWAAFPYTPYPGDRILTTCACDECRWEVRNLRGKSWKQIGVSDLGGDGGSMSPEAFRYYLPGLLVLALNNPPDASMITALQIVPYLTVSETEKRIENALQSKQMTIGRLTRRQRDVIVRFLDEVGEDGQIPEMLRSARENVLTGEVRPFSDAVVRDWLRQQSQQSEAESTDSGRDRPPKRRGKSRKKRTT